MLQFKYASNPLHEVLQWSVLNILTWNLIIYWSQRLTGICKDQDLISNLKEWMLLPQAIKNSYMSFFSALYISWRFKMEKFQGSSISHKIKKVTNLRQIIYCSVCQSFAMIEQPILLCEPHIYSWYYSWSVDKEKELVNGHVKQEMSFNARLGRLTWGTLQESSIHSRLYRDRRRMDDIWIDSKQSRDLYKSSVLSIQRVYVMVSRVAYLFLIFWTQNRAYKTSIASFPERYQTETVC